MKFLTQFVFIILLMKFYVVSPENNLDVCDRSTQKCPDSGLVALILGGTGATGKHVLEELNSSDKVSKIIFISRRNIEFPDMPKVVVRKIDFDNLDEHSNAFADADIAFSCLGTTRAKSGAEGFVKVDFDYIVNTAKILKDHGRCKDFHLVSSTGASESAYFLYPSTKGKTENHILNLKFDRTSIYRPGVLIVPEGREEIRAIEWVLQKILSVFDYGPYFSIPTNHLAKAMVKYALKDLTNVDTEVEDAPKFVRILENKEISDYVQ